MRCTWESLTSGSLSGNSGTRCLQKLGSATSFSEFIFDDSDLDAQWHEFADSTNLRESDVVPFLSSLTIKAGAPSLRDKEIELTGRLKDEVCAGSEELASRVFTLLAAELRRWTTAAGDNAVTAEIVRECICGLNRNPMEAPIGGPRPHTSLPKQGTRMLASVRQAGIIR